MCVTSLLSRSPRPEENAFDAVTDKQTTTDPQCIGMSNLGPNICFLTPSTQVHPAQFFNNVPLLVTMWRAIVCTDIFNRIFVIMPNKPASYFFVYLNTVIIYINYG